MNSEGFSVIVTCWYDPQADATRIKVVRVDTTEEVQLSAGSFLLRISRDKDTSVERCLIRHIPSGREAYVQGGPNLRAFIKDCALRSEEPKSGASDKPET